MKSRLIIFAVLVLGTSSFFALAQDASPKSEPASAADLDFFEKRVRPLLVQRCFECHSAKAERVKGGLQLDSREAVLAGGDSGPATVIGDVENSLIVRAIRYDGDTQMPPAGKLPESEIAVLTEWVRRGLPFPASTDASAKRRVIDIAEGKKHWAFQPLVPSGADTPHSPESQGRLDDFLRRAQPQHGLTPSPEASRAVLIRRLAFDLIGLPPTPAEVREFVADESTEAYERLVERLLADPRFGERWARLWLDLARYCDIGESWREGQGQPWLYRDWVARAMNEDVPYDEFVRKQLAADLLPNFDPADAAALGFLGLSPTYWKELKLDHNVIKQVVAEEWEERIEAIGGTFLGLTLACARCHDHKFDPVTQQDYYGLAGVLASIKIDDRPIIEKSFADRAAAARATIKESQAQLDKLLKEPKPGETATDEEKAKAAGITKQIESLKARIVELQSTPHLATPVAFGVSEAAMIVLPDGEHRTKIEYKPGEPQNVAMQIRGNAANVGVTVPRRFVSVLSSAEPPPFQSGSGRLELANAIVGDAAPLAARVIVNRVWAAHFGRGLVTTLSNFGTQGEKPSHPELLDDLASRFIEHGWSLKWLHRQIVLSATYRQKSGEQNHNSPRATSNSPLSIDPDNLWLSRMPLRKLDVEAWRDAMLSATGELQRRVGGEPRELNDAANDRRTIYGTIKRRELADVLRLHDFPDPISHVGSRTPTTTPLQQLFVLNSPFLQARAAALAKQVQADAPNDLAGQIQSAYRRLFGREASPEELQLGSEFITSSPPAGVENELAWRQLAQALLASNELLFVE